MTTAIANVNLDAYSTSQYFRADDSGTAVAASASGAGGVAMGNGASATGIDSVAIGHGAVAAEDGVVSVGGGDGISAPAQRRITNVANGRIALGSTDALTGDQLFSSLSTMAGLLGGGAAIGLQGSFVAPSYVIQCQGYGSVGSALAALDAQVTALYDISAGLMDRGVANDPTGTAGGRDSYAHGPGDTALGFNARVDADQKSTAVGANAYISGAATQSVAVGEGSSVTAANGTAIGQGASVTAANAVALGQGSIADRANSVSVGSVGAERQITNVAAGTAATDAVNKGQLDSGIAGAVSTANSYTDSRIQSLGDTFQMYKGEMDDRFRRQDRRIDRQGAMNAAMLNMASSAAGINTTNRLGVGVGFQAGEAALSLGYQRALSEKATVTFGGAFSGDDKSIGMGAGFGW